MALSKNIKKNLPVLQMSCASCASSVQNILLSQKGVSNASVNFASGMVTLDFDSETTNLEILKQTLVDVGFDLMIDEDLDTQDTLEELHKLHLSSLKRNTIAASLLSLPIVAIAMIPQLMHMPYANYIMWLLSTLVIFIFGKQFFIGAYKQAKNGSANMDTLVALSTGIAYMYSVFNTLFPEFWIRQGLEPHVYFEAAAVVVTFILLGKLLEENAKGNTSASIRKLIGLQPKMVTLIKEDVQVDVLISDVQVGDIILVKPGDKIAVDGVIIHGLSFVDESLVTGEPIAIEKQRGDRVYSGTINQKGSFQFKAEKVGSETLLAQIIKMVQDAQGSKAPVQKLVDQIASIFVPVVILIAILSFSIWFIFGGENSFTHALLALVTVLVIACPCALGLATPTAIMVGIGKGAENGILIKDAEGLESLQKVTTVVLDKTGTITEGKPIVTDIRWIERETSELRSILFSIEKSSEHPLAGAICDNLGDATQFVTDIQIESLSGKGIVGIVGGVKYIVGNRRLIDVDNIVIDADTQKWIDDKLHLANTVVFFGEGSRLLGVIAIADKIKESSVAAIQELKRKGIDVHMLTGDNKHTANSVASQTGVEYCEAEMLPHEKVNYIKNLQSKGEIVAMVGDGINDSGALAQADVSIAMGKGSDIAMDVAKMTIISNDLRKIPQAILLSKQTVTTIKQNLFWAFIYNLIGIPIAAGILFPLNGFLLNPMLAGAAMALSSVSVVSNSLRLKLKSIK